MISHKVDSFCCGKFILRGVLLSFLPLLPHFSLRVCQVPFDSNFKIEYKLFIQHLVFDNDCCIGGNVIRTEINLVQSDNLVLLWHKL